MESSLAGNSIRARTPCRLSCSKNITPVTAAKGPQRRAMSVQGHANRARLVSSISIASRSLPKRKELVASVPRRRPASVPGTRSAPCRSGAVNPTCPIIYSETVSLPPQLGGGVKNGADVLVVAGAPAEVAGEPVARFGFRRIRIAVQQGLGCDQQARRAETALQRRML